MRLLTGPILATLIGVAACGSSDDSAGKPPLTLKEIGRMDVGPAGGTVSAGAVTIEIPEGALTETRSIVINEANADAYALPTETHIVGALYVLQPEDVTFAKPVTIRIRVDEAKKTDIGKGALVLFRTPTGGAAAWKPYGATDTTQSELTGQTNHFSAHAPTEAPESYCYLNQWSPIDLGGQNRPDVLPGLDAKVPKDGGDKAVLCSGTAPDKGPPYECHCVGAEPGTLGTYTRLPPDTAVTAFAVQCGAPACAPKPTFACDLGLQCDSNTCSTSREPKVLCNGTSCSCQNGGAFTVSSATPTNDEMVPLWLSSCGGASCEGAGTDPNSSWVCAGGANSSESSDICFMETQTCRDNHVYRTECPKTGTLEAGDCKCLVDGVVTKTVHSICVESAWVCGWPALQGAPWPADKACPIVLPNPLTGGNGPADPPSGCKAQPAGDCRDGHTYYAECPDYGNPNPSGQGICTCKVDGAVTKTFPATTCDESIGVTCGWPKSR